MNRPADSPAKDKAPRYAELHCLTNFSFLRAASHPDELVAAAGEQGYAALAVTDRHSLAGVVRAHAAAKPAGLKLLIGAECRPVDAPAVVLLAIDRPGYGRLTRLLTLGKSRASKGECRLTTADLAEYGEGLLACVLPEEADLSGRRKYESVGNHGAPVDFARSLGVYRAAFGDRACLLAEAHRGPSDAAWLARLQTLSRAARVPLVAAGGVYYHTADRRPLQDVLTAIRLGRTVAECGTELFANAERHLKSRDELARLFRDVPGAIERTLEVAGRCTFSLDELRYEYPEELCPAGQTPQTYLQLLTWRGAAERYPAGVPEKVHGLLEHELRLIGELRYEAYFLTVWDIVRFARSQGILCQGRGSAANSAVCYCLDVTAVDPERADVLFERFISKERNEAPDIDVDFEHERREEVLQYLYGKYGRERAAMTAEVICYRSRAASREVGKALGLPPEQINTIAKTMVDHPRSVETKWQDRARDGGLDPDSRLGRQFISLVGELIGFPRHLSQHVGGMVMTQGALCEVVPIENAKMPGRTVIEWNKDDLDELGILKVDCLALGMLTAIRKGFELIKRHSGRELTLANIPAEDPLVYDMICEADTIGVFQIESRAQMSMLPRLQPREFYDLVIEVAIVRPGPIQGKMVHPYLRRRAGEEPIEYPNNAVREVLRKTLGVPIFQEQAMRLAVVAAGFTPGEADQLRRAMAAWRRTGAVDRFRDKLLSGMAANGLSAEFAERVYQQICGFGEYGFPESHAASFALLVYVSAWLKRHYPAAFCAALLNSQPMGFYAPGQLIRDARAHNAAVLSIDVNHSAWDATLETAKSGERGEEKAERKCMSRLGLRLGMRLLSGMPQAAAERIVEARRAGPFRSPADLARRAQLNQATLALLARADALHSLEADRRAALWQALPPVRDKAPRPLFDAAGSDDARLQTPSVLGSLSPFEEVLADYRAAGLSLRGHPISFVRAELDVQDCLRAAALGYLEHGRRVRTAGLVLLRQRPGTAQGITFVTLEDETGVSNLVIRPDVWQRYREVARAGTAWIVDGRLERHGRIVHVLARRLIDLTSALRNVPAKSRDFH